MIERNNILLYRNVELLRWRKVFTYIYSSGRVYQFHFAMHCLLKNKPIKNRDLPTHVKLTIIVSESFWKGSLPLK